MSLGHKVYVVDIRDYPDAHYIGRAAPWISKKASALANPFSLKKYSREDSIKLYREYFESNFKTFDGKCFFFYHNDLTHEFDDLLQEMRAGKDVYLGCWCKRDNAACHGDIIKEWLDKIYDIESSQ